MHGIVILLLFLSAALPVRAELPPYDPEKLKPNANVPPARELPPIYRGPSEFKTIQFSDGQSADIKKDLDFGYHLEEIIIPYYNDQEKEISAPYYKALETFTENAKWLLLPQHVIENTIHWDPEKNKNKQRNIYCARIFNQSKYSDSQADVSSTGQQVSSGLENERYYENLRILDSVLGRYEYESITPGYFDFNRPEEININDASGYCMRDYPSTTFAEVENPVIQLASWGLGSIPVMGQVWESISKTITYIENGVEKTKEVYEKFFPKYKIYFTEATVDSNHTENCHWTACTQDEVNNTKYDDIKEVQKNRGGAFFNLPESYAERPDLVDPKNRAAQTEYDYGLKGKTDGDPEVANREVFGYDQQKNLQHPWSILGSAKTYLALDACSVVDQKTLDTYSIYLADDPKDGIKINDVCNPPLSPTPAACPIDKIAKMNGSPSCKLTNVTKENLYQIVSNAGFDPKAALPNGLPPLAQQVLNAAADQYGVPASVLLGTMIDEGAFMYPEWVWADDEAIKTFSDCTNPEPMLKCEDHANSTSQGAQGPFGILQSEWEKDAVKNTIFEAFPDRPKENVTSCNFVDAAYTAAKVLSRSAHYFVDDPVPNEPPPTTPPLPESCNGQAVSHERNPLTQCSQWDASRVALARMQYAERACTPSVDILVNTYKTYTSGAH